MEILKYIKLKTEKWVLRGKIPKMILNFIYKYLKI